MQVDKRTNSLSCLGENYLFAKRSFRNLQIYNNFQTKLKVFLFLLFCLTYGKAVHIFNMLKIQIKNI